MSRAPFDEPGGEDDGVREDADARDVDLDDVPRLEREVVGRDEAGPGEEDAARRDGIVSDEELDELGERALHPRRRRLAREELTAFAVEDPQADLERLGRGRGGGGGGRGAGGRGGPRPRGGG